MGRLAKIVTLGFLLVTMFTTIRASTDVIATDEFLHRVVMRDGVYELYWSYDQEFMTFLVFAKTRGFVTFGFSPDGKLRGSDLFIGGVEDDRDPYHGDYHIWKDYDIREEEDEDNDKFFFTNIRDGIRQVIPDRDWTEDWELLETRENATHTGIKFRRRFETCDLEEDVVITNGTMRILWGYGEDDSLTKEGMIRGNMSVYLKAVQVTKPLLPFNAFSWDFRASSARVGASGLSTLWCQAFEIPFLRQKHHVILFEPLIQTGHAAIVNHISLHGCRPPRGSFTQQEMTARGECSILRQAGDYCTSVIYSWGSGGEPLYLPEPVGFPMGDGDQPLYFMLEVHYHNRQHLRGIIDSSGVRLTLTPTLRRFDAGIMEVGHVPQRTLMIPPRMENFTVQGYCPGKCLLQAIEQQMYYGGRRNNFGRPQRPQRPERPQRPINTDTVNPDDKEVPETQASNQQRVTPGTPDQGRPDQGRGYDQSQGGRYDQGRYDQGRYSQQGYNYQGYGQRPYGQQRAYQSYGQNQFEGITVFSTLLRVHEIGRRIRLRHIRSGIEMMPISGDENYDINLQEVRLLNEERLVMPRDDLIVECTYNTTERSGITWGGISASQEVCSAVVYYYPKISLSRCQSYPLAEELFPIVTTKRTTLSSWQSDVTRLKWSFSKSRRLEQLEKRAKRHVICESSDNVEYPIAREIMRRPVGVSLPQPWPQRRCNGSYRITSTSTIYLVIVSAIFLNL